MGIYEENLEVLKSEREDLYIGLMEQNTEEAEQVLVGDALDGEKFLAYVRNQDVHVLNSTYHPTNEAIRYVAQFKDEAPGSVLLLFGMGNGMVVEAIMKDECPIGKCVVYEPSISIFRKVLEEYDVRRLLEDRKLLLIVKGINDNSLESILYEHINFRNWNHFLLCALSKYDVLFPEEYKVVKAMHKRIASGKGGERRSLVRFAQAGMKNEVKALKWLLDCKVFDSMRGVFPQEMPCIIVAAGPSLEKNAEELRRAKGKAFIICVDSALSFLLERGIVPDLACTVDPQKGAGYFQHPMTKEIPMALATDSDYNSVEAIGEVKPIYVSTTNDYYTEILSRKGLRLDYLEGGGSVATLCFQMGVELGFRTIIIVGQDLAFSDDKAHAGKGELNKGDLFYGLLMVEGYNGGEILTRADFKIYIDWYNMTIPALEDRRIINATEGGAKLQGAVQMPLKEAVDTYCVQEWNVTEILNQVPKVWNTQEEKLDLYQELKQLHSRYKNLQRMVSDGLHQAERAITLLQRGNGNPKELNAIDKQLEKVTREVSDKLEMRILIKRMIDADIAVSEELWKAEDDLQQESIRLYGQMKTYLSNLLEAVDELLPIWKEVLDEINEKYHLE
ncbi:MAG: motility associated factor glycosyltransferase family protein [Lachnospiraceae bacterium]|nr:motility associated factor glycosyltransferase family protein [Lachnospiraceae bacterium]